MQNKNKYYLISGITLGIIILFFVFNKKPVEVDALAVKKSHITSEIKDTGIVQPALEYNIYSTQNSIVKDIPVEVGQKVGQNDLLITLENPDLTLKLAETRSALLQTGANLSSAQTAVNQTRLELDEAKNNLDRITALFNAGAVSQTKLEEAQKAVKKLEADLSKNLAYVDNLVLQTNELQKIITELEDRQKDLVIKSPIIGTVMDLKIKKGQPVSAGTLLAVLADGDNLEIKADIASDNMAEIKPGQDVIITSPVLGNDKLAGKVAKIYPRAEEKKSALGVLEYRVPVIISIDQKSSLKPGYEVNISIITQKHEDVIIIPREAVRTTDKGSIIMRIVGGKIKYHSIETGLSNSENIQIKSGLKEGDLIVKNGSLELKENTPVKIRQK